MGIKAKTKKPSGECKMYQRNQNMPENENKLDTVYVQWLFSLASTPVGWWISVLKCIITVLNQSLFQFPLYWYDQQISDFDCKVHFPKFFSSKVYFSMCNQLTHLVSFESPFKLHRLEFFAPSTSFASLTVCETK